MNRLKATVVGVSAATILAIATTGSLAAEKKEITFAAIATEEMAVVAERWQPTIKYLSEKADLKINFFASTSYAAAVEALINDFADVAMLGPKIYTVLPEGALCLLSRTSDHEEGKQVHDHRVVERRRARADGSRQYVRKCSPQGPVPRADWRHLPRRLFRSSFLRRQP
jgi:ABC-type phosphate/phosphonate transport system substrate-binding protein